MTKEPSSPSSPSSDFTNTDPFDGVAYSDIVEGSLYYEKEVSAMINTRSIISFNSLFLIFYRWKYSLIHLTIKKLLFPLMLLQKDISELLIDTLQERTIINLN